MEVRLELLCEEAALDEQWLFVRNKSNQRWAMYGMLLIMQSALYSSMCKGKRNTQKIKRKDLNFKTWIKYLARKTICFSKLEKMHDTTKHMVNLICINYRFNECKDFLFIF